MKLIKKLFLILLMLSIVYTVYASVVRIYVFNRGINTNDNTFNLEPNTAKTATNVYIKSGKLRQRYATDSWKSYGSTDQGYRKTFYYSPETQLVGNVEGYIVNLDNAGNGYLIDNSATPVFADIQSPYPILVNSGVGYPSAFDCEIFRGVEYCTGYKDRLQTYNIRYDNVTLFKLDGRMSSNLIQSMDLTTGWSALGADTANIAVNAYNKVEGSSSIEWDKTGTTVNYAGISKTVSLDLSEYANYYLTLWTDAVFSGTSTGTYFIRFTTAGTGTDFLLYALSTGATNNKYNLIDMNSPTSSLGSTDLANITSIEITLTVPSIANTYVDATIDALTFYPKFFRIGIPTNTGTLSGAVGAGGVLTGSYTYKFSCKAWDGTEGNVGPVSNTVTATADKIDLTSIDVCTDDHVNVKSRVIYRNRNGTSTYWKVTEIENNVATTYTDNTPDSSLVELAPSDGDTLNDNGVPALGSYIEAYNNRLFIGPTEDDDNKIQISDISDNNTVIEPESFPTNNFEIINPNDNDGVTGMKARLDSLLIGKPNSLYSLEGTKPGEYFVEKLLHNKGTRWNSNMIMVDGVMFFLGEDSIYAVGSDNSILDVGYPIKNQLNLQDEPSYTSIPLSGAEFYPTDNQIWFLIPSTTNGWNSGFGGSSYIAILNLDTGLENPTWTKYEFTHDNGAGGCEYDFLFDLEYIPSGLMAKHMLVNMGGMEILKYPVDPLSLGTSGTGDESACTFTAVWETKALYECGQETSPATPKKYDWIKLIGEANNAVDLTLSWGFADWNNGIDSYNYSQTVSLDYVNGSAHFMTYPKIPLSGASGNDRNLSFQISHVSGIGGASTEHGDQFILYGYEYKCQDLGGEF